jgi:hypothetical protein
LDFFDDDDDAPTSDQPTRESRRIRDPEDEPVAADPEELTAEAPEAPGFDEPDERPRSRPRAQRASRPRPQRSSRPPRPRGGSRSFSDAPVPDTGGGPPSRQQVRSRQLILIGVGIVVLILLFLAFRGCQSARKERSFTNYVSDLSALTVETKQLSDQFFGALEGKNKEGDVPLSQQINGDRGTAQGLADRAANLDAPDDLSSAQTQIALSYDMRRDALDVIAAELPNAQGKAATAEKAIEKIQQQMEVLLASDVLYNRAKFEIEAALDAQGITVDEGVPESDFLPEAPPDFLDTSVIQQALSEAGLSSSSGSDCTSAPKDGATHGLELVSTTAQPSGTVLQPSDAGIPNTLSGDDTDFEVAVLNGGDGTQPETDVDVTLSGDFTGQQTISSIDPQEQQTVTISPKPTPKAGDSGQLTVDVATVCGEQIDSNNKSTYDVTFGG